MGNSPVHVVTTMSQLKSLDPGAEVEILGKRGFYVGLGWVSTCSCGTCPNTFQFPFVLYQTEEGIKKTEYRGLGEDLYALSETIKPGDERYPEYKTLL